MSNFPVASFTLSWQVLLSRNLSIRPSKEEGGGGGSLILRLETRLLCQAFLSISSIVFSSPPFPGKPDTQVNFPVTLVGHGRCVIVPWKRNRISDSKLLNFGFVFYLCPFWGRRISPKKTTVRADSGGFESVTQPTCGHDVRIRTAAESAIPSRVGKQSSLQGDSGPKWGLHQVVVVVCFLFGF